MARTCAVPITTLALALLCAATPAAAGGRVGILVMGAEAEYGDLADQCAEVLVAGLAGQGEAEIVGKEEFLARMALGDRAEVEACLRDKACLARAETVLGLAQVVFGYLGGDPDSYRLHLMRVSVEGSIEAQVKQQFPRDAGALLAGVVPLLGRLYTASEASLRISSTPVGAAVYLDDRPVGTTPLLLPKATIGLHKLRLELEGYETHHEAVEVTEGGALARIPLTAIPAARPDPGSAAPPPAGSRDPLRPGRGAKLVGYGLAATSVVALAAGGVLHTLAYLDAVDYEDATRPAERSDIKAQGQSRWNGALVSYGLGLALAGGAAVAFWMARPPAGEIESPAVAPPTVLLEPLPGGGAVLLRGRF